MQITSSTSSATGLQLSHMAYTSTVRFPSTVLVTNIPAPYRNPVYQRLALMLGQDRFHVVFFSQRETNRDWQLSSAGFPCTFLRSQYVTTRTAYIHYNPAVITTLRKLRPDIVITTGFNPSHLLAVAYAALGKKLHIPMTDGTLESEQRLTALHRLTRRFVYSKSQAFIGASEGSRRLYESYGVDPRRVFTSRLCANNPAFSQVTGSIHRSFDFMYAGRFSLDKNPLFAIDVAAGVAQRLGRRTSLLMLGSGPELENAKRHARTLSDQVDTRFAGFVQQEQLPEHYASAKVLLFPSQQDTWGVVANEACAAGQAVIVSPHAGVAGELILNGHNGFVCPLRLEAWVTNAHLLITDEVLWAEFSANSMRKVDAYTYDLAAEGIRDAINAVSQHS